MLQGSIGMINFLLTKPGLGQKLNSLFAGIVLLVFVVNSHVHAQSLDSSGTVMVGLSFIKITSSNNFMQLRYRNEAVAEGQNIKLLSRLESDGFEAALFEIHPGNGMCRGGVVGVNARKGEEARFDRRLIDVCAGFDIESQKDSLLLIEKPRVSGAGSLWRFRAKEGLRIVGSLEFTPEPGTGFEILKPELYTTMQDLLTNQAIFRKIEALTGVNSKSYLQALTGYIQTAPVFDIQKRTIFASGCFNEKSCTKLAAFLFVDQKTSNIYLAHKSSSAKPIIYPDISRWPLEVKQQYSLWEVRLKL
jgi:hypothetical protein